VSARSDNGQVTPRSMFSLFPAADLLGPLRRDLSINGLDPREVSELLGSLRGAAIDARRAGAAGVVVRARRNRIFRLFDVIAVVHESLPRIANRVAFAPNAETGSAYTPSTRRNAK
jgi:hypothetical protein